MPSKPKPYEHGGAKRRNIPTDRDQAYVDELRERIPFTPAPAGTEGPRLSWRRGVDGGRIETDAMPLYIHEKVSPAAFVEQISRDAAAPGQSTFFDDFNGFPPDARYDWYRHEGNWQNRIIRGNSVEVMASLAQKEGMAGEVQLVYFDPPYGIGFNSNYQGSTRKRTENRAPVEAASRRAFRDTYVDGLHSYMDTVFRIAVHARALLRDSGSFFLQIGTENVHRLSVVLDEVFGPENRVATIAFAKSGATSAKNLPQVADWLLWYAKDRDQTTYHQLYEPLTRKEKLEHMTWHAMVELLDGTCRDLQAAERVNPDAALPEGARLFRRMRLASPGVSTTGRRWRFDGIELSEDAAPSVFLTHEATLRVVDKEEEGQAGPSAGTPDVAGERVAIATVPDDRTATAQLVDDAALLAARRGFRKLVIVAFHFDAQARNEERGKLQVVLVRANRDLTIRDLKSGREDTAFVLVGEPDVETIRREDGTWQVRVRGYQVYDPGTGNVRPAGKTSDIDCWMLDTDHDGRSFFARRIHFPGKSNDKQIKALKRELGARVDPEQWEFMESLTSAPFRHPESRRVAVRIVTTFGDEMLAVVELPSDDR